MPADTKERILRAALECFTKSGVSETRVSDIHEASGVSIGSIYHHFGDKEGIASALVEYGIASLNARIFARLSMVSTSDPEAIIGAIVRAAGYWGTDEPALAGYVLNNRSQLHPDKVLVVEQATLGLVDQLSALIEEAQGSSFKLPPAPIALALVLGPIQEYSRRWITGRADTPPAEYVEVFAAAAWKAVRP